MRKIDINGEEVSLDPSNLQFSHENLNDYLCKVPALYAYYSDKWAEAQHVNYCQEDISESVYAHKFEFYKNDGVSDKLAEAKTKSDKEVMDAKSAARQSKLDMQAIYGYLRALDKAHENALNLGYNIRKEMDKIHPGIKSGRDMDIDKALERVLNEE